MWLQICFIHSSSVTPCGHVDQQLIPRTLGIRWKYTDCRDTYTHPIILVDHYLCSIYSRQFTDLTYFWEVGENSRTQKKSINEENMWHFKQTVTWTQDWSRDPRAVRQLQISIYLCIPGGIITVWLTLRCLLCIQRHSQCSQWLWCDTGVGCKITFETLNVLKGDLLFNLLLNFCFTGGLQAVCLVVMTICKVI